ncbi:porin family protein [Dysgonomonas sp. 216]|uniref:outer membrane beta-barrel protein n=1 Tax=Dysgonomonas sp. 216 TaxID=2302934 RepID=UPI0013D39C93|nr:outer membrane beta-barrel protein [Dysgonomonas sp. 216]NDW18200.1 porin family protein [Dysgonomonas sp. 216]
MKKILFALALSLGVVTTASALEPGKMWVGGSVGLSSTSVKVGEFDEDYLNYKILPEFGYVVNDKIGVGIVVGFQQTEVDIEDLLASEEIQGKVQGFVINPFVRYSVLKGSIGGIFVDGGVGFSQAKNKDTDLKATIFDVGFRPGIALNVSDKVVLTAKFGFLGYQNTKLSPKVGNDLKINEFGFDFDLNNCLFGASFVF